MSKILIVDDEQSILDILSMVLIDARYEVETCLEGFTAIEKVKKSKFDLVLLDIKMPKMDGIEVLENILKIDESLIVIMISGHGNYETAVEATKKGAYNYIQKPPDYDELKISIKNALEYKKSKDEIARLKNELIESSKLIGESESMKNVRELIGKYADVDLSILITGESGTGKMLAAKQLHSISKRVNNPFITINCATLNSQNLEDELFGVYDNGKIISKGKLEDANGGIILFDEVCNLSLEVQSKILKVLDENKFSRPGQKGEIYINARFFFTTNKNLEEEMAEGRFREDLYHRINVLQIFISPLRDRVIDIEVFLKYFTNQVCKAYNIQLKTFSDSAIGLLKTFRFPGNVRELKNILERLIITVDKEIIEEEDIDIPGTKHSKILTDLLNKNMSLNDFQNESEKTFILKMLNDYKYNISHTAEALQIQRSHLYKLLTKYNIPTPSKIK